MAKNVTYRLRLLIVAMLVAVSANAQLSIIITISTLNIQEIYLNLGKAFGNADTNGETQQTEAAANGDDNGEEPDPESNDGDPISVIIDRWINRGDRPYLAEGLTINKVAEQMNLNKRLLSQYLNNVLCQNFNAWLNELKVNEGSASS